MFSKCYWYRVLYDWAWACRNTPTEFVLFQDSRVYVLQRCRCILHIFFLRCKRNFVAEKNSSVCRASVKFSKVYREKSSNIPAMSLFSVAIRLLLVLFWLKVTALETACGSSCSQKQRQWFCTLKWWSKLIKFFTEYEFIKYCYR